LIDVFGGRVGSDGVMISTQAALCVRNQNRRVFGVKTSSWLGDNINVGRISIWDIKHWALGTTRTRKTCSASSKHNLARRRYVLL